MIRIAALNDSSSGFDDDDARSKAVGTREAEESEAYTLYNKALGLQRQDIQKAEEAFEQLLSHGFIREAAKLIETETVGITHPGLQLLYSIYKNLAAMSLQKGDHEEAMEWYIEAVKVDESETTVWYKIGTIALKLHNYQLARLGFEQGLQCNPNHWPCLDNIITVLYTINDYWYCLYYISKALKKDYLYPKGIVFRNQIHKEQPSLKEATQEMFKECNSLIDTEKVDQEEIDEYVNEALKMRQKRRELARTPPMKPNKLPVPVKSYTWLSLGESLIALYDNIKKATPPKSLSIRVDLSDYAVDRNKSHETKKEEVPSQPASSTISSELPPAVEKMDVSKPEEMEVDHTAVTETLTNVISTDSVSDTVVNSTAVTASSETALVPALPTSDNIVVTSTDTTTAAPESVILVTSATLTSEPENVTVTVTSEPSALEVSNSFPTLSAIPISVTSALQDNPGSENSDTESKVKGQKRKKSSNFDNPYYEKRRSARVRNTFTRREEERVNFREILETFIPPSLRSGVDEEEMETLDVVSDNEGSVFTKPNKTETGTVSKAKLLSDTEENDVREFLEREQKNGGLLMLMLHFLESLCDRAELAWPPELASIYVRVYTRWRRHIDLPCLLSKNEPEEDIRVFGKMLLLKLEFHFDQWLTKHLRSGASPKGKSPGSGLPSEMPKFWEDDMDYIFGLQGQSEVMGPLWLQHCVRAYWLQARLCLLQGEIQYASCSFHKAKEFLKWRIEDENAQEILLRNCQSDNWISIESIERHQDSLERSQSMDEMQKLFEAKEFEKVVELLLKAVNQPSQKPMRIDPESVIPPRIEQLCLLHDCLQKMGDMQRSIHWGEVAFHEAFQGYKKATTSPQKDEWSAVLNQIWSSLLRNLEKPECLKELSGPRKNRLTYDLVSVIDIMMSVPEKATDMPIGSVLPWMILYSIIHCEEEKFFALHKEQESTDLSTQENLPSSLMLLNVSHEYLGSHSWCTKSDGKLLIFFMDVLEKKLKDNFKYTDDLRQMYEQCVYCLYGHPNKKGKAKHLADHNVPPLTLTLPQAIQLFEYYKPKNLPEFDSFKTDTVSAELESLLRRIIQLIPEEEKPANRLDKVQDYIDGTSSVVPTPVKGLEFSTITKEIYYLLADYYFKNNEHPKAIKFYMYDICVCPLRLDSWAGLALARMYQLEQKLNSTDLKLDVSLRKRSGAALRCFDRAVDIEDAYGKLWMEYGSLSYQLHAHSSRQLSFHQEKKHECDVDFLPPELQQSASSFKLEMLDKAFMCYKSASQCVDEESEEWLTDYMMGKCLEKMHKSPMEYLNYYRQAAAALHEENATYPKKIAYAYTAHTSPRLAVEALEMFYRLHVSILKLLLKGSNTEDYHTYAEYIEEAANSPFARGCEKKDEESGNVSMDYDDTKTDKTTTNQQDHTYSKSKDPTNMMDNVDENQVNIDSADSMDEKLEDSANNSRDSSEYFPSAEPSESSQDVGGNMETEDSMLTFSGASFKHQQPSELPKTIELSAEVLDSCGKIPDSEESAASKSDSTELLSKQRSLGFIPSGMVEEPKSNSELSLTEDSSLSKTGMDIIEIFSSPEPIDPKIQPKFFTPDNRQSSVESDDKMEIVTSSTVQNVEEKPEMCNDGASIPDTKAAGDVQSMESLEKKEEKVSDSMKQTGDNTLAVKETDENKGKESESANEAERSKESDKILPDKTTNKPESDSPSIKTEVPSKGTPQEGKKETNSDNPAQTGGGDTDTQKHAEENKKEESSKSEETEKPKLEGMEKPKLEGTALRKDLIEKCMAALHLCLSRFPTHYKSTYRLAYVYFYSTFHKNLQYARDLLLGNPQWQSLSYMPAQGLFSERKVTNFFQGTWRLPISEVERAGSFATHLNRAVLLLLKVLLEQKDVPMLYHLHLQLNRTPDAEKKYLRDAERLHYSKLALDYCLTAIKNRLPEIQELQDTEKAIKLLMETYKIYNYGISKMKATIGPRISNLLAVTYKAVMKEEVSPDKPLFEQAIKFCQLYHQQNTPQRQGTVRSSMDSSLSDSSLFSPDRLLTNPFRPSGTPQSPVKTPQAILSSTQQTKSQQSPTTSVQVPPSKPEAPQSPAKLPQTSTAMPSSKPQTNPSTLKFSQIVTSVPPKPKQPIVQLTKLQMTPQTFSELTKEPSVEEPKVNASAILGGVQSKTSASLSVGSRQLSSGISAISLISSLIEDGINKANKQKTEKAGRSESMTDEPPAPISTPATPKLTKATSPRPSSGMSRPPLHLIHPKKRALMSEEVIEILSSDEEEEAMEVASTGKSGSQKEDVKKLTGENVEMDDNANQSQAEEEKKEIERKNSSGALMTGNTESESKDNPSSSKVMESKMEAGTDSGKDGMSDVKDVPYLDPSTGLFVTDSDSQSSVYVANPENISFEDELMVEDD
ncbi:calcineurin-binding protein cabin-1-like [Saccostrea echinata]|uniref:calcineurin-binding protein cabin-1-like n=1 Tax=Saccostrea echinata TaxID=191078 RepID=UPI002A82C911|nr:calcineurin-binding protein cabin-1-like [Saccostrea echinata]